MPEHIEQPEHPDHHTPAARGHMNAALVVSAISVAWTSITSAVALVIGFRDQSSVLIAFGMVGIVDAVGSAALVHHFRHGLRHDGLADNLERRAHRIVIIGLFLVGFTTAVGGVQHLVSGSTSRGSGGGVAVAGASFAGLVVLSVRKVRVARRVSSDALLSDGHLTAIGAAQAAVTITAIAAERWFGWHRADSAGAIIVGLAALVLSFTSAQNL